MRHPISFLAAVWLFVCGPVAGQSPITSAITDNLTVGTGLSYSHGASAYTYGAHSLNPHHVQNLTGFTLPTGTYFYNIFVDGQVVMRRVNNASASGRRTLVWMESSESGSKVKVMPPYTDSMELFFDGRTINKGTDNLFGNGGDGSGNNNNIERVDWIIPSGMSSTDASQSGFAIFERGADGQHDPFCVAAILSLDASGAPATYGPILRVSPAHYGNLPSSALNYSILRKEEGEPRLYRTNAGTQNRGGVFISFLDLGVADRQTIHGYSLMAYDLPLGARPEDLLDYNNPEFFPTTTSANTAQGGIDLIAITGLFNTINTSVTLADPVASFVAKAINGSVRLGWALQEGASGTGLVLQRSREGQGWTDIAALPVQTTGFTDPSPGPGKHLYRLRLLQPGGDSWSPVQRVDVELKVHPLDAALLRTGGGAVQLRWPVPAREATLLRLIGQDGRVMAAVRLERGSTDARLNAPGFRGPAFLQAQGYGESRVRRILIR